MLKKIFRVTIVKVETKCVWGQGIKSQGISYFLAKSVVRECHGKRFLEDYKKQLVSSGKKIYIL